MSYRYARTSRFLLATLCALYATSPLSAQAIDPAKSYREAQALMANGEIYRAVDALMAATAANPAYADAWAALAQCHYELREYERSLEFLAQAVRYGPRTNQIMDLEGFCYLAVGRLDDARASFSAAIAKLPGDRDARFGLALLDIRAGRSSDARARLIESLKLSPQDPRALLSMALIARAENKQEESASYMAQALRWNAGDADVSYMAAVMAAESGLGAEAARLCRLALEAQSGHANARGLLASLYYESGALDNARAMLDVALKLDRKDSQAWYLSGLVEAAAGNFADAEYALSQLASLRPDDEIARLAVEHLVMDLTGLEDPVRAQYAAWRLSRASELERRLLYDRAMVEYRRALAIDPYSNKARRSYAALLRLSRLHASYYAELAFLKDLGKADRALDDALEAYASFMQDSVQVSWKADSLALAERPWKLAVFSAGPGGLPYHAGSDMVVARYLRDLLTAQPQLSMAKSVPRVTDFADAYRLARESGADWFILVRVAESEREVLLSAELRSARTGALAVRVDAPRSGNDRVSLAVARLVSQLSAAIPLKGTLMDRRGDLALIDMGKLDGLAVGDQLLVIRAGAVAVKPDASGLAWSEADVVASFTLTRLDDEVSEGTLTRSGFFDRANPRDILVRMPAATGAPTASTTTSSVAASTWTTLFDRVRSLY